MKPMIESYITTRDAVLLRALLQRAEAEAAYGESMEMLLETLSEAQIVDDLPGPLVRIGCRVRYVDGGTGSMQEIVLVLPHESAPAERRISVLSPLGCALLARAPGDRVSVALPNGRSVEHIVVQVTPPDPDDDEAA